MSVASSSSRSAPLCDVSFAATTLCRPDAVFAGDCPVARAAAGAAGAGGAAGAAGAADGTEGAVEAEAAGAVA
jgi:hypothetical protein